MFGVSAGALDARGHVAEAAFRAECASPAREAEPGRAERLAQPEHQARGGVAHHFADCQCGQSVACGVQVLPVEDADGASLIDDGVSTVQALVDLKAARAEGKLITDAQLLAIFEQGLQVTVVAYPDNDDLVLPGARGTRGSTTRRATQSDGRPCT